MEKTRWKEEGICFRVPNLRQHNPEFLRLELAKAISVGDLQYILKSIIKKAISEVRKFTMVQDKRRYAYIATLPTQLVSLKIYYHVRSPNTKLSNLRLTP